MSGRTSLSFRLGVLAITAGLLVSLPRAASGQGAQGVGRSERYIQVPGIRGTAPHTQTLYVIDELRGLFYVFEYKASSSARYFKRHAHANLRRAAREVVRRRRLKTQPGEHRPNRYTLTLGIPGTTDDTQTLYVTDGVDEILFIFEYNAKTHKLEPRKPVDLLSCALSVESQAKPRSGRSATRHP